MGVNRKRLGRGEGLTERRLPSMAAGRGVWGANSFWTNPKGSKGLLTLCPRKYICNKRPLLPEVRLREARPPVSLALGSACFVPGPPWQRRGDAEQALGPFPTGCWQRIRTGPVPAAAQCYLFRLQPLLVTPVLQIAAFSLPSDCQEPRVQKLELASPENSQRHVFRACLRSLTRSQEPRSKALERVWGRPGSPKSQGALRESKNPDLRQGSNSSWRRLSLTSDQFHVDEAGRCC